MSTYAYRRVSTDSQADSGAGLEAQAIDILKFTKTQGLEIDRTFTDGGYGRESILYTRPGMGELLSLLTKGDTLVVHKYDRIGGLLEVNELARLLKRKGCRLLCVHGDNRDTPESELMRNLLASVSTFELRQIGARITAALRAKKGQGQRYCKRLYGMRPVDGRFVPDEAEQAVIQRILASVSRNESLNSIAQALNRDGIPAPTGDRWRHSTIRRIAERVMAADCF